MTRVVDTVSRCGSSVALVVVVVGCPREGKLYCLFDLDCSIWGQSLTQQWMANACVCIGDLTRVLSVDSPVPCFSVKLHLTATIWRRREQQRLNEHPAAPSNQTEWQIRWFRLSVIHIVCKTETFSNVTVCGRRNWEQLLLRREY